MAKGGLKIDGAGQALRAEREKRGWTLDELACRSGYGKGLLSKYENNLVALSEETIRRIAQALGERPVVVACICLRAAYPSLAQPESEPARLIAKLIDALDKTDN